LGNIEDNDALARDYDWSYLLQTFEWKLVKMAKYFHQEQYMMKDDKRQTIHQLHEARRFLRRVIKDWDRFPYRIDRKTGVWYDREGRDTGIISLKNEEPSVIHAEQQYFQKQMSDFGAYIGKYGRNWWF
jgi:hypothetical protein